VRREHATIAQGADLLLIIVTGSVGEGIAIAVTKAGARDYVMKGDTGLLGAAIDRVLADAAARNPVAQAEDASRVTTTL
jgi:FixJ family two-component response regulator